MAFAAFCMAACTIASAQTGAAEYVWSRYWDTPTRAEDFPEASYVRELPDLGVAFSGGGNRSASATIGELSALADNEWLPRVRYMTAVSGGSWAAVPFTYSQVALATLLPELHDPTSLTRALVDTRPPEHSLARAIVDSRIAAPGAVEAGEILGRAVLEKENLPAQLSSLTGRVFGGSTDRTYANILARAYITPLIDRAQRRYGWNETAAMDVHQLNAALSTDDFVQAAVGRPYLIVGGTMIYMHPAYDYPRLIPVEYTPLYTGVRQQFGTRLGGIYVWPFAYNATAADRVANHMVRVRLKPTADGFRLQDMIGSSGAAPLLTLFLGKPLDAIKRATAAFPTFNHFTIRNDQATPVTEALLHGDGGFTDNLGIMPLLARQVHNIILFVNTKEPYRGSKQIEEMFISIDQRDGSADRSGNVVFKPERLAELMSGFDRAVEEQRSVVYCGNNWEVLENWLYKIQPYTGLNICWVYLHKVPSWDKSLPDETRALLHTKGFRNFPWFSTFGQNVPYVIRLKPEQVNLLSQFAGWSIRDPKNRAVIEQSALGRAVLGH